MSDEALVNVVVNGEPHAVPAKTTLEGLMILLEIGSAFAYAECNGEVVGFVDWENVVQEGDRVDVVQMLGGG